MAGVSAQESSSDLDVLRQRAHRLRCLLDSCSALENRLDCLDDSLDAVGSTTSTKAMSALANAADKMTLSDKDLEEQTSACVRACFRQRRATGVFFRVNVA